MSFFVSAFAPLENVTSFFVSFALAPLWKETSFGCSAFAPLWNVTSLGCSALAPLWNVTSFVSLKFAPLSNFGCSLRLKLAPLANSIFVGFGSLGLKLAPLANSTFALLNLLLSRLLLSWKLEPLSPKVLLLVYLLPLDHELDCCFVLSASFCF